jgi:hypothetical protein
MFSGLACAAFEPIASVISSQADLPAGLEVTASEEMSLDRVRRDRESA